MVLVDCGANGLIRIRKRRLLRLDWWTDLLSQDMLESLALETTKSVKHQSIQFALAVTNQGSAIMIFIDVAYTLNHHTIMSIIQKGNTKINVSRTEPTLPGGLHKITTTDG
mmetsp:Transcript_4765/g.10471  ORF Transcript_4765/g.10471 Transcript_4765/m.10471 type:complete len:111 (-) Transcript_4765:757-1089(-)